MSFLTKCPVIALIVFTTLSAMADVAVTQETPVVTVGSRVRLAVTEPSRKTLVGPVVEFGPNSVILDGAKKGKRTIVPFAVVEKIELSTGQRSRPLHGLAVGAIAGAVVSAAAVGAANGFANCDDPSTSDSGFFCIDAPSFGKSAAIIGLFSALGAMTGLFQSLERPEDVWTRARFRHAAASSTDGRRSALGLGLGSADGHVIAKVAIKLSL